MKSINPAELLKACKTMDELKQVWTENVDDWKRRKDFDAVVEAKDNAKYRLQWPTTLKNAMLRYNEMVDAFDSESGVSEAIAAIDDGRKLELQMAEMVQRVLDEKWRIDADGLAVMKSYVDWRQNFEQLKFEVAA